MRIGHQHLWRIEPNIKTVKYAQNPTPKLYSSDCIGDGREIISNIPVYQSFLKVLQVTSYQDKYFITKLLYYTYLNPEIKTTL